MAAVTGKGGSILYAAGSVATIHEWSMDIGNNLHDVTSFTTSAAQWRTFVAGLSDFSASADGTFDPSSTGQNNMIVDSLTPVSAAAVFELDQTAGGKLSGNVFVEGLSVGAPIDGLVGMSWSLQGTGTLTYTTTT